MPLLLDASRINSSDSYSHCGKSLALKITRPFFFFSVVRALANFVLYSTSSIFRITFAVWNGELQWNKKEQHQHLRYHFSTFRSIDKAIYRNYLFPMISFTHLLVWWKTEKKNLHETKVIDCEYRRLLPSILKTISRFFSELIVKLPLFNVYIWISNYMFFQSMFFLGYRNVFKRFYDFRFKGKKNLIQKCFFL